MICEEERQDLIADLIAAQVKQKGEDFVHRDKWEAWWQKQGGDIVIGLHDLVFGEEDDPRILVNGIPVEFIPPFEPT